MKLASLGKDIPDKYCHDPSIKDDMCMTVAMIYAIHGIVPSRKWLHDTGLQDIKGNTVAMYLAQYPNIIIP